MIIFIYGKDSFRSQQKIRELKNKFIKEVDCHGSSIKNIKGEIASLEEINRAVGASSLFSKKRLIIIENISENKSKNIFKKLRDYLEQKEKVRDNVLIFVDKHSGAKMGKNVLWQYLLKQQFVQNFAPLNAKDAAIWAIKLAKKNSGKLDYSLALKLTAMFGSDLWRINNELKKVINYKSGLKAGQVRNNDIILDEQDFVKMSQSKINENIFALTDAIGNKNRELAMFLLEKEIEAGAAETYLMHMIVRQFRILLQIRQGLNSGLSQKEIVAILKLHPYVVQKSLKQAGSFSLDFLRNIFLKLIELDKNLKIGQAEFKVSLGLLIAKL